MPTYEYRCPEGHQFELFQKMSEEPRATCPECGAESERLLSAGAGFLFKGGGFYITDHRSDAYKRDASKDSSGAASSASSGASKSTKSSGSSSDGKGSSGTSATAKGS